MRFLQYSAALVFLTTCYGYTCPNDGSTFYHAMVSSGCRVYHFCENSVMTTLTCPEGQAFDHHTSRCNDASLVHCEEMGHHHHHHKRSVEEEVHVVSIEHLKTATKDVLSSIKTLLKTTLKETAPTVYDRLKANYTPIVESIRADFEPIVKDKILPRMDKFYAYAKRMGKKIYQKVHRSVELSNSTHISIVSFTDILDEVSKDIQPVLNVGRYFSARLVGSHKSKRSVSTPVTDVPELLLGYMEPALKGIFSSMTSMLSGDENTITSKVIVPIIFNMTGDPETMFNLKKVFWSSKAAFAPLVYEMLKRQSVYNADGTIIRIPQEKVMEAQSFFYRESLPIIRSIFEKHMSFVLYTLSNNTELLFEAMDRWQESSGSRVELLKDYITRFYQKHRQVLDSSDSEHLNTYTLTEIKKDLRPIEITLLQMFLDYFSHLDNSFVRLFLRRESFIRALFPNLPGSTFAVPSGSYYEAANESVEIPENESNIIRKVRQS